MKKKERLKLILTLISEQVVTTQDELMALLEETGVFVGQATISRDLAQLDLIKIPTEEIGVKKYAKNAKKAAATPKISDFSTGFNVLRRYRKIYLNKQMIIFETYPGNAFLMKQQLKKNYPSIPMLSDDDTVVMYFNSQEEAKKELRKLSVY